MKWIKGYVAGLLTALLLCGLVVTAGAKSGKVMQELTYRDIRVSLDGNVLDLRNAIGEKVEPFMFDGTNYLPVRALAEALGLNVAWDGKEVMVVLTTPEPEPESVKEPEAAPVAASVISGGEIAPITENSAPVAEPEPQPVKASPSNKADLEECQIEIKGARLAREYGDTLALVVSFQWTNNGKYTQSSVTAMKVKASQNGAELGNAYPDGYDSGLYLKSIAPGETLEFERAFALKDAKSPVEITVSNLTETAENPAKMTFRPADMKQAAKVEMPAATPTTTISRTVYVTKTGKHYHYSDTCNGGTYYPSTLSEALGRGLTPCDKCVLTGT